jgi:hypothetical protein
MNIPGMMGRGGMMGGAPQASSGDTPQVDTAENVQISSLALLKMLKHGTWRDRATTPRATGVARGSLVDDEPQCEAANPRAGVAANARHGRNAREAPIGRVTPEGVFEPFGCKCLPSVRRFRRDSHTPSLFLHVSPSDDDRLDDVALTFPFLSLTCDFPFHDLTFSRHLARHLPIPRSLQAARASRWR